MNKILRAIQTLHIRFMEAPTERKAEHIQIFLYGNRDIVGSYYDVEPPILGKLIQYCYTVKQARNNKFDTKSMAQLQVVAEEIFG